MCDRGSRGRRDLTWRGLHLDADITISYENLKRLVGFESTTLATNESERNTSP